MMNWGAKLGENIDLERVLNYLSTKLKIKQIRFQSMEKSNREVRERKLFIMREKMMKNYEI